MYTMVRRIIKEFLTFSKWEQKGIILLLALIVVVVLTQLLYHPKPRLPEKTSSVQRKIEEFESMLKPDTFRRHQAQAEIRTGGPKNVSRTLFDFDPNSASVSELMLLGFSSKQAEVIERYRLKGGVFRSREDFQKVFVVSGQMYTMLAPYIKIKKLRNEYHNELRPAPKAVAIDLNTADTTELKRLTGVGIAIAKRIASYRDRLGGFVKNEQLMEVYGLDSTAYERLKGELTTPSPARTIKINRISFDELKRHPYLNAYQARNIIYYRMKRGLISDLQELVSEKIITKESAMKLKEYIDYSN